jgi:hypothetical protein
MFANQLQNYKQWNYVIYNKVIRKVTWLGGKNGQFLHNRSIKCIKGMKFYKMNPI